MLLWTRFVRSGDPSASREAEPEVGLPRSRTREPEFASALRVAVARSAVYELPGNSRQKNGRWLGAPPKPYTLPATAQGKINLTDLDSRNV